MPKKEQLTIEKLIEEAQIFCVSESTYKHKELYGVTDGKAVGTLIEQKFQNHLNNKYELRSVHQLGELICLQMTFKLI